jgi:TolB-like protein
LTLVLDSAAKHSVAVLPFENITKDQKLDWLSMGISETITNDLVGLDEIVVVERLQLMRVMKEQNFHLTGAVDEKTVVHIGRLIGADILVVGGFQKMENMLRLTARFIDVETGGIIQTAKATGKMDNVFDIQDKIVEKLAENLKINLNKQEFVRIGRPPTQSLEAYQHLGQGALLKSKKDYQGAAQELIKAVKIDPEFEVAKENFKEVFWDLNNGNYWSYTQKGVVKGTNVESEIIRQAGGIGTFNGKKVFYYVQSGEGIVDGSTTIPIKHTLFYIKGNDGIYAAGHKIQSEETQVIHTYNPPYLIFPYDFNVGAHWKSTYVYDAKVGLTKTHFSSFDCIQETRVIRDEEVTVPAGTFKTFVVRMHTRKVKFGSQLSTPLQTVMIYWFAPGVGIVKSRISDEIEVLKKKWGVVQKEELKEYHIE